MAGEIHDFNKKRKRPKWSDDKGTGKYYDSGDISAIQGQTSAADSTLKPGEQPKGQKYVPPKQDDKSANKYYANRGGLAPTKQQIQRGQGLGRPAPLAGERRQPSAEQKKENARRAADPNANMTVEDKSEINGVLVEVVNRLQGGQTGVVVYVKKGDSQLLRRARAALEMLVTKEVITEEQYHEVRLSYTLGEDEQKAVETKLGIPQPKGEKAVDANADQDEQAPLDPLAFLKAGGMTEDDEYEASIVAGKDVPVSVDTSDDVASSPAPAYPSAPASEDEDDSDFMAPTPPLPSNTQLLVNTRDELDRAIDTDKPVRVVDAEEIVRQGGYELESTEFTPKAEISVSGTVSKGEDGGLAFKPDDPKQASAALTEISVSENLETPANVSLSGGIETPVEAMDGVGEAPTSKKPGRRSGRGSK